MMLIVQQNQSNVIVMTLSECFRDVSITGTTTGFTLTLENDTTKEVFSGITLTDTSNYTERYNKFNFVLTGLTSQDYTATKIYLKDSGTYLYKVYYVADDQSELIEKGILRVDGEAETEFFYDDNDYDPLFQLEF